MKNTGTVDLHGCSAAEANALLFNLFMDHVDSTNPLVTDLVIITGKGIHSTNEPVLHSSVQQFIKKELKLAVYEDHCNSGRLIVPLSAIKSLCFQY